MSNGAACCILGVCCPPPKAQSALADLLRNAAAGATTRNAELGEVSFADEYEAMAAAVNAEVDHVPTGAGALVLKLAEGRGNVEEIVAQIQALYAPMLRERAKQKAEG